LAPGYFDTTILRLFDPVGRGLAGDSRCGFDDTGSYRFSKRANECLADLASPRWPF
jgi:hypothetical protein